MNVNLYLNEIAKQNGIAVDSLQFPDCELDVEKSKSL